MLWQSLKQTEKYNSKGFLKEICVNGTSERDLEITGPGNAKGNKILGTKELNWFWDFAKLTASTNLMESNRTATGNSFRHQKQMLSLTTTYIKLFLVTI